MSQNKIFRCAYFSMHFGIKFLLFNDFPLVYCIGMYVCYIEMYLYTVHTVQSTVPYIHYWYSHILHRVRL